MQSEKKIVDDFAKVMNGLAGTFAGMGREAQSAFREKAREFIADGDAISRDEFEAVKAMAAAARDENEALKARIVALEAKVPVASAKASRAKPGA